MDTLVKKYISDKNNLKFPVLNKKDDLNIRINSFDYNYYKNEYILELNSGLIQTDNYTLSLVRNRLIISITEHKQIDRPVYVNNYYLSYPKSSTYERIRSVDVYLPGKDFYLIRQYFIPDKSTLSIILSTIN